MGSFLCTHNLGKDTSLASGRLNFEGNHTAVIMSVESISYACVQKDIWGGGI